MDSFARGSMYFQVARFFAERTMSDIAKKGKWTHLTTPLLKANDELYGELYDLIKTAYEPIGGHLKIRSGSDIAKETPYVVAVDIDDDPYADAVLLGRMSHGLIKLVAMGQDASAAAKAEAMRQWAKMLNRGDGFAEVSGAIAHICLTKLGSPTVDTKEKVEALLGKPVSWIGARPDGKYPDHPHWYERSIAGEKHMKILVGKV